MLDVHAPHETVHTWKDFVIHIAAIAIGLLLAVGLEQTVEALRNSRQRHQLEADLRTEARNNKNVIERDLHMRDLEPWFVQAERAAFPGGGSTQPAVRFTLTPPPCIPGSVGVAAVRYFAPSEAVWTAATQSGLVVLLPVEQSRMQARLAHNYALLEANRDKVYDDCQAILAMRQRLAHTGSPGTGDAWAMDPEQAEKFAATASQAKVDIQALLFRLRWSEVYEDGIARGEADDDLKMMTIDQTRYEDPPGQ
jgi:hypothetical protein